MSQLSLSRVWLADGRVGEALSGVERARAFLPPDSTSPLLSLCHALEGRIAIEIGDLDRATRCAQSLQPGNRASLLQARIELARSELDRADDALARCTPATMRERLDVALLSARVAHARNPDEADSLLAEALALAKIEGFVVAVTDELVELRPRVTLLLRSGRIEKYEQAVLDRLERDPTVANAYGSTSGPLSSRELTVVRYLASRLTLQGNRGGALRFDQHAQDTRQADLPEARGFVPHRSGHRSRVASASSSCGVGGLLADTPTGAFFLEVRPLNLRVRTQWEARSTCSRSHDRW